MRCVDDFEVRVTSTPSTGVGCVPSWTATSLRRLASRLAVSVWPTMGSSCLARASGGSCYRIRGSVRSFPGTQEDQAILLENRSFPFPDTRSLMKPGERNTECDVRRAWLLAGTTG